MPGTAELGERMINPQEKALGQLIAFIATERPRELPKIVEAKGFSEATEVADLRTSNLGLDCLNSVRPSVAADHLRNGDCECCFNELGLRAAGIRGAIYENCPITVD